MAQLILEIEAIELQSFRYRALLRIDQWHLSRMLSRLEPTKNPLGIKARDLLDYLESKGQLASVVALAGSEEKIRDLLAELMKLAIDIGYDFEEQSEEPLGPAGGTPAVFQAARVIR